MAESLATTMKQAVQVVLILFAVCALIGIIPATEAYSANWYQYWGGVAALGGLICAGFYLGRKGTKPPTRVQLVAWPLLLAPAVSLSAAVLVNLAVVVLCLVLAIAVLVHASRAKYQLPDAEDYTRIGQL